MRAAGIAVGVVGAALSLLGIALLVTGVTMVEPEPRQDLRGARTGMEIAEALVARDLERGRYARSVERATPYMTMGVVLGGGGGVLATVGLILFLTAGPASNREGPLQPPGPPTMG
jgi:hypothetical protein